MSPESASARWDTARKAVLKKQTSAPALKPQGAAAALKRQSSAEKSKPVRRASIKPSLVPTTLGESLEIKQGDRVRI